MRLVDPPFLHRWRWPIRRLVLLGLCLVALMAAYWRPTAEAPPESCAPIARPTSGPVASMNVAERWTRMSLDARQ